MKKGHRFSFFNIFPVLIILFSVQNLCAQVNQDELQDLGQVEFINYVGPYTRIETREQIRSIGYSLGLITRTGQERAGAQARYFIIHSVSDADGSKIDADIMGLGPDVGVDHIRNLRTIIQGYLEAAYEYSASDSQLLAEYITIYNAVFRGDTNYFSTRYKNDVMDNITADRAGLSIRYDEWPGRTLMLIPLGTGGPGDLTAIDTTFLTDPVVTEQLREEVDAGLDTRRGMVDLQERQAEEANQQAATQRQVIEEAQTRITEEREELQEARERDDLSERDIQQIEAREQALDQRQEQLQQQVQQADRVQDAAQRLTDAAQQGRQEIAADQQALIARTDTPTTNLASAPGAASSSGTVLGISILSSDASLGQIVLVEQSSRTIRRRSGLTTVNARTVYQVGGKLIAIAGENRGNAAIRLVEINRDTLEMVKQGDDDIAPTSLMWVQGNDIYAISSAGGNLYIARFDNNLERQARSSVMVHPFAGVSFMGDNLITQRADGTALILNPSDLAERR